MQAVKDLDGVLEVDPMLFDVLPIFIGVPFEPIRSFHPITLPLSFRRCAVNLLIVMKYSFE